MKYTFKYRTQVESYKHYIENSKSVENGEKPLTYWEYRKVLSKLSDLILEEVLNNSMGFKLPLNLGTLIIIGRKARKNIPIRKCYYKLTLTEGYIYGLHWIYHKVPNGWLIKYETPKLFKNVIIKAIKNDKFFKWIKFDTKKQLYASKRYL